MVRMLSPVLLSEGGRQKKVKKRGGIRKRRTHIVHTINHVLPLTRLRSCDNPAPQGSGAACEDETGFKLKLLILPYCPGIGGHWDAEHCQGDGEGGPGDCGSDKILHKCFMCYFQRSWEKLPK